MRSVNVPPTSTPIRVAIDRISSFPFARRSGATSQTAAPEGENRSLLGPAGEVGLVRVEVVLDALVDDRDVLVAVDRDLRRGCDPEAVDLIPDRLTLGLVERLPALRQQCVRLLDAGRAQVEPDPALEVVAEEVAGLDDARAVEAHVRLRLVLLERVDVVAR